MTKQYWIKPIMLVLAIFIVVAFLIHGMPTVTPAVDWDSTSTTTIAVMPWLIAFALGIFIFVYTTRRK